MVERSITIGINDHAFSSSSVELKLVVIGTSTGLSNNISVLVNILYATQRTPCITRAETFKLILLGIITDETLVRSGSTVLNRTINVLTLGKTHRIRSADIQYDIAVRSSIDTHVSRHEQIRIQRSIIRDQ